jgi:predicted Zn-dependent peptidase
VPLLRQLPQPTTAANNATEFTLKNGLKIVVIPTTARPS